jgi:16S rRNA (cytosine967-C5)-methyltransferase
VSRARQAAASPPGYAARRGAAQLLAAVLDRGRIPDEARLDGPPETRAEARALADLALRRLGQIDAVLGRLVARAPKPPVRQALRVMAAEILFGGGAAHAAVDLAVRQVKGGREARAAGLVNAVGRRLAAEGPTLVVEATRAAAPGLDGEAAAARVNTPDWLWERLAADWGEARAGAIAAAHLVAPPIDLSPRDPAEAEALADLLGAERLPTGSLRLPARRQVSALPGFEAGRWWVQDAAAALPAALLPADAGRVLDLCAAPGGKTLQLAARGARVTALDISEARLDRLRENLARTGLAAEIVCADAFDWAPEAPFDAVLLDAPCSATGTIRRHPDLPRRLDPAGLADLEDLQGRLLARAWDWVRPGGTLVYATCSLLRSEGEDRAARFRAETGARPAPVSGPFAAAEGDMRTLPDLWSQRGGLDGFFAARFTRPA